MPSLEDGHEGQPPWGLGGPPASREEGGEVLIGEQGDQLVAQRHEDVAAREGGACDARRGLGDGLDRPRVQGHG